MAELSRQPRQPAQPGSVDELIARLEGLIEAGAARADPLAWYVEALHLGDVKTIAMTAIRSGQQSSASA